MREEVGPLEKPVNCGMEDSGAKLNPREVMDVHTMELIEEDRKADYAALGDPVDVGRHPNQRIEAADTIDWDGNPGRQLWRKTKFTGRHRACEIPGWPSRGFRDRSGGGRFRPTSQIQASPLEASAMPYLPGTSDRKTESNSSWE